MMRALNRLLLVVALCGSGLCFSEQAFAQSSPVDNEGEIRIIASAHKKLFKGFRVVVAPEMRTSGWSPERFLLYVGARYKVIDYLSLRAGYRAAFVDDEGLFEQENRINLDAVGMLPLKRWKPSFRLRYTGTFGSSMSSEHRLRYSARVAYRPKKSDFSFFGFGELFHGLDESEVEKMRYGLGAAWDFYKTKKLDQTIGLRYHLDYHLTEYKNVHAARLSYRVVF